MKTSNKLLVLLFLLILLTAAITIFFIFNLHKTTGETVAGNGKYKLENRNLPEYNILDIAGPFDVKIKIGKKNILRIQGDSNILPCIKTDVDNGTLYIFSEEIIQPKLPLEIEIQPKNLKKLFVWSSETVSVNDINNEYLVISLNGKGFIAASGKTKNLVLNCDGSGNINTSQLAAENVKISLFGEGNIDTLATNDLNVKISGAGSFTGSGRTKKLDIICNGAGCIDTKELLTDDASITLRGAATAEISVEKKLNVKISGLGKVIYYGKPGKIEQKITGLGKIVDGEKCDYKTGKIKKEY